MKITSSDARLRASVETVKEGETYSIQVTPESTDAPGFAIFTIEVDAGGVAQTLHAYGQIKAAAK